MKTKEPISTFSNLFFIVAAVCIQVIEPNAKMLSFSLFFLGLASAMFHSGGSEHRTPSHRADEFGMYMTLVALNIYVYNSFAAVLVGGLALTGFFMYLDKIDSFRFIPALSVIALGGMLLTVPGMYVLLVLAGALMVYALRNWLRQTDLIHGLYHLVAAATIFAGFYFVYLYRLP